MKKIAVVILLTVFSAFSSVSLCFADENLTVWGLKGPSGIGMIRLFENPPKIAGFNVSVEAAGDAGLMAGMLTSGSAKVGILPPNVAAKIASFGKNLKIAAVTGEGMLRLLTADLSIKSIEGLRGKSVSVAGQGSVPEYVFRKILMAHNLKPDTDINMDFSLAYPEIAQSLIAGRISSALIPEPFASMAQNGNSKLYSIADVQAEWIKAGGGGSYPMTVLVIDGAFADANPTVIKIILDACKDSINWVKANPAEAGDLVEKHKLGVRAPVVTMSVPRSNYVFVDAVQAKPQLESLFKTFLEFAPASIGGKMPQDSFYYAPR
ncbi:lipoprotein [Spirochaetia bacterium]|nr:lipoprotein [Spirochaetia bacterium]